MAIAMWWIKELFSSARFLIIQGDNSFWESKRIYEVFLPIVFTAGIFILYLLFPMAFSDKFLSKLSGSIFQFMVFVVPFHLAALAAFATFERAGLDSNLEGANAIVRVWSNKDNDYFLKTLTLRQYASLLFGYLCPIGVLFIVFYIIADNVNFIYVAGDCYVYLYKVCLCGVLFFITHYAFLSIYSITFLFDKINKISS